LVEGLKKSREDLSISHEKLKITHAKLIDKPSTNSYSGASTIIDDACATNFISYEASIFKENVEQELNLNC
jgi:hypothetical protein